MALLVWVHNKQHLHIYYSGLCRSMAELTIDILNSKGHLFQTPHFVFVLEKMMVVQCWSLRSHHFLKQKATLQLQSCFNERLRLHVMGIFGNVGKTIPRQ